MALCFEIYADLQNTAPISNPGYRAVQTRAKHEFCDWDTEQLRDYGQVATAVLLSIN